jgi:hypothetical protein
MPSPRRQTDPEAAETARAAKGPGRISSVTNSPMSFRGAGNRLSRFAGEPGTHNPGRFV